MTHDAQHMPRYPLGEAAREETRSRTGKRLGEITLEAIREGRVGGEDVAIHPDTLRAQAEIAEEAGYPALAANLRRAAELATLPDAKVLAIYEALRPYRVTHERLLAMAAEVETEFGAVETAALIRQAAAAYRQRGLF